MGRRVPLRSLSTGGGSGLSRSLGSVITSHRPLSSPWVVGDNGRASVGSAPRPLLRGVYVSWAARAARRSAQSAGSHHVARLTVWRLEVRGRGSGARLGSPFLACSRPLICPRMAEGGGSSLVSPLRRTLVPSEGFVLTTWSPPEAPPLHTIPPDVGGGVRTSAYELGGKADIRCVRGPAGRGGGVGAARSCAAIDLCGRLLTCRPSRGVSGHWCPQVGLASTLAPVLQLRRWL